MLALPLFLAATDATREEILSAVRGFIGEMDTFQLRNAGSTLAGELPSLVAALRQRHQSQLAAQERKRQDEEWMAENSRLEREKALEDRKKLLADDEFETAHRHEI